jgi:hypothetical protein
MKFRFITPILIDQICAAIPGRSLCRFASSACAIAVAFTVACCEELLYYETVKLQPLPEQGETPATGKRKQRTRSQREVDLMIKELHYRQRDVSGAGRERLPPLADDPESQRLKLEAERAREQMMMGGH